MYYAMKKDYSTNAALHLQAWVVYQLKQLNEKWDCLIFSTISHTGTQQFLYYYMWVLKHQLELQFGASIKFCKNLLGWYVHTNIL